MIKSHRYLLTASIIGIVAIICLMLLYRQLATSSLLAHETRANVALTEVFSRVISKQYSDLLNVNKAELDELGAEHPLVSQLGTELQKFMRGSKLVKIKIYNLDGLTIFSTDPSQLGDDKKNNAGFLTAKAGETASNVTFRSQFDAFEGTLSNINVVSSYIPVYERAGEQPTAVFELYSDVTELLDQMQRQQWQIIIGVLSSVAVLYLLLLNVSRRADGIETKRLQEASHSEAKLRYQATHDQLTGLINRHEFESRAEQLIATTHQLNSKHALCFMDLDQFKVVNDTCGHVAGDELLRQLGDLLRETAGDSDILARLGGDEFGVLMENCTSEEALDRAQRLLRTVQNFQFAWEGESFRVGISIGLAAIDKTNSNLVDLLKQADSACFMAKEQGRNRIHVFRPGDTEMSLRAGEMQWVSRINQALGENRFTLYAQPIVSLGNGPEETHYEVLIRMLDEEQNIIAPDVFIPAAERYDLMEKIDTWTITNTFELLAAHPEFVQQTHSVTINLSGQSLTNKVFLEQVIGMLNEFRIDPAKICFEVTETSAISHLRVATHFIKQLRELGCQFALDDFGSGLSSFGYLKNLQVDLLKIDGMFVKNIADDRIDHAMVQSINDIGHVMGMKTIAEFVETEAIRKCLVDIGVDYAQGYGIARPLPFEQVLGAGKVQKVAV